MNQNPSGPNFNPNPYEPNPNYPATPGTGYGGSQAPLGPNSNPNFPNSNYGVYSNPNSYAPPPPVQPPYPNPSTPPPPSTEPNPYDPYAPTAMSQQRSSGFGYQSYPGYPPIEPNQPLNQPSPTTPPTPQKKSRLGLTIALVTAAILAIGGSIFGVAYTNNQNTLHANATATANVTGTAQARANATANAQATAAVIASHYPFSANQVLNDPLTNDSHQAEYGWNNDRKYCFFANSTYHDFNNTTNYNQWCAATRTDYTNFTYQADLILQQGNTKSSEGLIFRADVSSVKVYIFEIYQDRSYDIGLYVNSSGQDFQTLRTGHIPQFIPGLRQLNTLAVVANNDQLRFYVNGQPITDASVTNSTYAHGQIGFFSGDTDANTEVLLSNAKVWLLP